MPKVRGKGSEAPGFPYSPPNYLRGCGHAMRSFEPGATLPILPPLGSFKGEHGCRMVKLVQGDCLEVLKSMEAETIQMVVTSPPYY